MNKLKLIAKFLISKQFLKHVGISLVLVIILFWGINKFLNSYTKFGNENYISVPDLTGVHINDIDGILSPKGLLYAVDSVSTDDFPKGTVIRQDPGPTENTGQYVKENRTIYLSVVSLSPILVSMPDLVYKSKKHAEGILKIIGLKVKYTYKPYPDCKDCVIDQLYNKKSIAAGGKVVKGSTIELILGQGKGNNVEQVPNLIGKSMDDANSALNTVSLSLYAASCESCITKKDSTRAKIYRQSPGAGSEISSGSEITVWLSTDPSKFKTDDEP